MAEVIVKLNPDDPDDKDKLEMLQHGWKYRSVLQELDNYLRGRVKHESLSDEVYGALETARAQLYEIADDHDIKVWE